MYTLQWWVWRWFSVWHHGKMQLLVWRTFVGKNWGQIYSFLIQYHSVWQYFFCKKWALGQKLFIEDIKSLNNFIMRYKSLFGLSFIFLQTIPAYNWSIWHHWKHNFNHDSFKTCGSKFLRQPTDSSYFNWHNLHFLHGDWLLLGQR